MNSLHATPPPGQGAKPSADDIQRLLAAQLSLPSRLAYTMLLGVSLAGTAVVGSLLLTESDLPLRTSAAMAAMVGIGLSWAMFAAWVLARRRVLFAHHRVISARMGVAFSLLFVVGAIATTWSPDTSGTGYAAAGVGLVMLGVAMALLVRAHRRVEELSRRRAVLEQALAGGARQ